MHVTRWDPFDMTVINVWHPKNQDGISDPAIWVNLWESGNVLSFKKSIRTSCKYYKFCQSKKEMVGDRI